MFYSERILNYLMPPMLELRIMFILIMETIHKFLSNY
jgi:hypothetical protein